MNSSTPTIEVAVIGSGLAGLTTAISLASSEKIKKIHIFEKEAVLGLMSNSNKASSGINGVGTHAQLSQGIEDTFESFFEDTVKSGKNMNDKALVQELVDSSTSAIEWLSKEGNLELSQVAKLGGHSQRRTHRIENAAVGYAIIKALTDKLQNEYKDIFEVHVRSKVTKLLSNGDSVSGLEYKEGDNPEPKFLEINNIVLATGGFSANKELVAHYGRALNLNQIPSSNGIGTTGDGIMLTQDLGVELVDMEYIQIHPTGFVSPDDPTNHHKILAGELMRGIGGLIMNKEGERFVNELTTRDVVSAKMLEEQKKSSGEHIYLVIPSAIADQEIPTHLKFYTFKKLLRKTTLGSLFSSANSEKFAEELNYINRTIKNGEADRFGRKDFNKQVYFPAAEFYVGEITPVVHFCMGGIKIDTSGHVLKKSGNRVQGLYAAGEVTGGVHGANRLGGSSLLECVVFGRKIAQSILSKL